MKSCFRLGEYKKMDKTVSFSETKTIYCYPDSNQQASSNLVIIYYKEVNFWKNYKLKGVLDKEKYPNYPKFF